VKRLFTTLILFSFALTFGFGQVIDDFETDIGNWDDPNFSGSTVRLDAASSITVSTEQAYAGASSGKVDLIEDTAEAGGFFVRMTNRVDQIASDAKVGFWAYASSQDVEFRLVIWDNGTGGDGYEAGPYWTVSAVNTWEYFELDLVNDTFTGWITGNSAINSTDNVTIESIQFNTTVDADAVFYIDDFGVGTGPPPTELFFSEYIEGGSNNKALEIYNPKPTAVDLGDYLVLGNYNGNPYNDTLRFPAGTMLAADDVYVVCHDEADAAMTAVADTLIQNPYAGGSSFMAVFNGDDVRGLFKIEGTDTTLVDLFGLHDGVDPGSGWDVAGVAAATKDHTLARKAGITHGNPDWASSAGTDAESSEWIVLPKDTWYDLGSHPFVMLHPVTFSVDMNFEITKGSFVVGTDVVNVAGSFNGWGGDPLSDDNADGIYEGTFDIAAGSIEYKFHINGTAWEGVANRTYTVMEGANTIPTVWFNDQEPVPITDVEVLLQVDMSVQLLNGNFDPGAGDLIVVRGGSPVYGDWGGAVAMTLDPAQTNVYTHIGTFDNAAIGVATEYKFVILTGGDPNAAIWEGSPNRSWTPTGTEPDDDSNGYGEILVPVQYFADVTPDDIITQDVTVTWTVDLNSAYHALMAGDTLIDTQTGSDDITLWSEVNGVAINGILSQWWDWGNDLTLAGEWAMDPYGTDSIGGKPRYYTYDYLFTAGQAKVQGYKYGINSLDNEAGFAQNREMTIDDAASTFMAPIDCFGSQNSDENLPFPVPCVTTVDFAVNMNFEITKGSFVPGTDVVNVAGSFNGWGGDPLTDDNADGIYDGTIEMEPGAIEYKFHINGTAWEGVDNRTFDVLPGMNVTDTVWFNNQEPVPITDVEVLLQVDMSVQLLNGNFDPGAGDLIVVRGSSPVYGDWGGAVAMTLDPAQTNVYTHLGTFDNAAIGVATEYKFVILTGGDPNAAIWEGSPNRSWTATGDEPDDDSNGYGEILVPVQYFADVTPDDIITQDVTVTFSVNLTSAYNALMAGDTLVDTQTLSDDITLWSEVNGVAINGILSQWWDWGNDLTLAGEWAMDAVDGGDMLDGKPVQYSFDYLFTAGQAKAQGYKYGINSLDNEAGFAQNREIVIDDAASTWMAPEDCFGSQNTDENLPFPGDCESVSTEAVTALPTSYSLNQNYPNPFNPTTTINFALPKDDNVRLVVFNMVGQEVRTLESGYYNAGYYSVTWDGLDNTGNAIPSGVYIYALTTGEQSFSKKMIMLK